MYQSYEEIQEYFDNLNNDLSHFNSSNDICTPMGCVKEMVDEIPEEFWLRNKIQILDPCCGNGNFPAYLALKTNINNIYCNEINPKRIANLNNYFNNAITVTSIDFLEYPENQKYDLIIANPPYAKFVKDGKRAAKNHNLSRDFVNKSLSLLNDDGYLVFILPDNWMSYSDRNNLPIILSNYKIITLNVNEAKKWFPGVGSSFTYFIIQKTLNCGEKTKFITKYGTEYVVIDKGLPCIPLYYNETIRSIFKKTVFNSLPKYKVEANCTLHKYTQAKYIVDTKDKEHPYRLIHTPNQTVWSSKKHIYNDCWKVFLPTTTYYKPFIDHDCGMTQSILYIKCDNEEQAKMLCEQLSNPIYNFVISLTNYGNFNNQRIMQHLTTLNNIILTEEEKNYILNFKLQKSSI